MKFLFYALLGACLVVGAWTAIEGPVDVSREPSRMALQLDPGRFHTLTDAELARLRVQTERPAATQAAATVPPPAPPVPVPASTAPMDLPSASCVEIGVFTSDAAARKARTRLAALGAGDRIATTTTDHATRLRITGVDAALEVRIGEVLRDFPKQELAHCIEPVAPHAER